MANFATMAAHMDKVRPAGIHPQLTAQGGGDSQPGKGAATEEARQLFDHIDTDGDGIVHTKS